MSGNGLAPGTLADNALYEAVARIARHETVSAATASVAVVTEVHTGTGSPEHAVSVRLRDRGVVLRNVPVAVGALGFVATPAVDDLVLVVFVEGDHHAPVVVGRLYHSQLSPPEHAAGQVVLSLPPGASSPDITTRLDPATPELVVEVGSAKVEITGQTATITIGDAQLQVDGSGPASIVVTTGQATIELGGAGDVTIEAANKLTLKGAQIEIEGSASVKVSGAVVDLN